MKKRYKVDPEKRWLKKRKGFYKHLRNLERRGVQSISLEVWRDEICYFELNQPNAKSREARLFCFDLNKAIREMLEENIVWASNRGCAFHCHLVRPVAEKSNEEV